MNGIVNQKPSVKDNVKASVWLFVNRNNDIGDTIKAFSTKKAAEKYFYEYIGQYIYDCIEDGEKNQLENFLSTMKASEAADVLYLYDPADNGEEFYIEEVVVDE